ncbi:MAG: HAMP domain-containing sensor histidine kinase [Gammaproteobacteria bacterium]
MCRPFARRGSALSAVTVDWRFELDTVLPLPATRVRQILINLLLNALQAALLQGQVSCSVILHEGALQLRVDNTGQAIDAVTMQHLFEPFASQNGTGLGLWVTYQLVQQLNGTIQAKNLHDGARFTVTLPLPQQQAQAA